MNKITLDVQGMTCNHCVQSVEKAVGTLNGVTDVKVTLAEGKVEVQVTDANTTAAQIAECIEYQGFSVVGNT